eukprot:COSAG06_NODE_70716_length_190_cov_96.923077_1_plen_44_part_10
MSATSDTLDGSAPPARPYLHQAPRPHTTTPPTSLRRYYGPSDPT